MVQPKLTPIASAIGKLANPSHGHARLGPSGAKKWLSCPGSIVLEAQFPNTSSSYADEGTACHTVTERCLRTGVYASSFIGELVAVNHEKEPRRTVEFTPEMAELSQIAADNVVASLSPTSQLWLEVQVDISSWLDVPEQFGTADVVMLDEYRGEDAQEGDLELSVEDHKFGRTPVPIDTPQLPLYALGAITALMTGKMPPPVKRPQRVRRSVIATTSEESNDDLY
jgi:hypothetical protein